MPTAGHRSREQFPWAWPERRDVIRPTVHRAVAKRGETRIVPAMSTVTEIESAIEKLSPQERRELAAWYEERQALLNASDALFQAYDDEEQAK